MGRGLMASGTVPMIGMWVAHYSVFVLAGASLAQIPLALIRSIEQRDTVSTVLSSIAAAIVVLGLAFVLHAVYGSNGDVEVVEHSRKRLIIEKSGSDIEIISPSRCRKLGDPMHLSQSGTALPLCEE